MSRRIGPGPGAYMLPPTVGYEKHDNRKTRKPMYSFGYRPPTKYSTLGPGPGNYTLNRVTRHGQDGTASYSLGKRLNAIKNDNIPGPGAHDNHLCPLFKEKRPPCYSMGIRTDCKNKDTIPAPNNYMYCTDMYKPRVPAYSMSMRCGLKPMVRSPGAAAYGPVSKDVTNKRNPIFSMSSRTGAVQNKTKIPGPNCYNLMQYKPGDKNPEYSFGIRHNEFAPPMIVQCDN